MAHAERSSRARGICEFESAVEPRRFWAFETLSSSPAASTLADCYPYSPIDLISGQLCP